MTEIQPGGKSWRQGNKPPWMTTLYPASSDGARSGHLHQSAKSFFPVIHKSPTAHHSTTNRVPVPIPLPNTTAPLRDDQRIPQQYC